MLSSKNNNNTKSGNINNSGKNNNKFGGGGAAAAAAGAIIAAEGRDNVMGTAAQKWLLQRDAVYDVCALPISAVPYAQRRRRTINDGAEQILQLLNELQKALGISVCESTTTTTNAAALVLKDHDGICTNNNNNNKNNSSDNQKKKSEFDNKSSSVKEEENYYLTRNIDEANNSLFRSECGLEVETNELRLFDGCNFNSNNNNNNNNNSTAMANKRLQPLQSALQSLKEIRHIPAYNKLSATAGTKTTGISGKSDNNDIKLIPTTVQCLQETIEEAVRIIEHGYAKCANSTDCIATWSDWIQPLIRVITECVRATPFECVIEEPRERLRRVEFDVKEKQREQEDAVTDGDMVRSEHLYFEKVALLEGMKPLYEQLEQTILNFKEEIADGQLKKVNLLVTDLTKRLIPPIVAKEKNITKRCTEDIERISKKREEILTNRKTRSTEFYNYIKNWEQCFQLNLKQQDACLQAIEELEQRLSHLADERSFLVEDRLETITQHRQAEDNTMAFISFANKQEELLQVTLRHLEQSQTCIQRIQDSLLSGYQNINRYLKNNIQQKAEAQLLEVRKERLELFRGLYLTLGELQFKKERHMEELDKRIQYYHVQQELAMDTFNPKAKEYSKAKKDLLEVKDTMQEQVELIAQKAVKQLEEFKPTEKLLIAAGVQFKHPVDELAEMNARRTQKLLEYHSLMSTIGGGGGGEEEGNGGNEECFNKKGFKKDNPLKP